MEQISCRACGSCVLVEKYSMQQTSVQWNAAAVAACPEIADGGARVRTCKMLRDSIDDAVVAGVVGVSTREMDVHNRGAMPRPGIG
jgi:hypothetical protein